MQRFKLGRRIIPFIHHLKKKKHEKVKVERNKNTSRNANTKKKKKKRGVHFVAYRFQERQQQDRC